MNGTIVVVLLISLAALALAWLAFVAVGQLRPSGASAQHPEDRERIGFCVRPA